MEFRLIYKGPLPAEGGNGGRAKQKQMLRKEFHKQLKELWQQHPDLRSQAESVFYISDQGGTGKNILRVSGLPNEASLKKRQQQVQLSSPSLALPTAPNLKTWLEHIADDHHRCGGRFVPLVSEAGGFTCALDILFLRRDNPGHIVSSGGDIDNRMKVLFDGLKMPSTTGELGGMALEPDENPFFCLLEDDSLITSVSITTDRLLTPQDSGDKIHNVELVIHVTVVNPSALFAGGRLV
jgi:hypothetical protein